MVGTSVGQARSAGGDATDPRGSWLDALRLRPLTRRTAGRREIVVGLIDGPVALDLPDLAGANVVTRGGVEAVCTRTNGAACAHGTFVAGVLFARRGSAAPGLCPGCSFVLEPIFESGGSDLPLVAATTDRLAEALVQCVDAGARIVNVSGATGSPSTSAERALVEALGHAARRGAVVVAAAGNQAAIGSSALTRHPSVVPVVASDGLGRPLAISNLGAGFGRRGIAAPGNEVISLDPGGGHVARAGTSVAAPLVTGALALLWSSFPDASAAEIVHAAVTSRRRMRSIVPPLLDVEAAYLALRTSSTREGGLTYGRRH